MAQSYHNLAYNLDAQGKKESNWLPAPKDEFNLFMRLYWPKKEILDGTWKPPAVERLK